MPPSASQTNILLIGAGAVGAFYASRLALAPTVSISAICRSNYSAVRANGFQITSPTYGNYSFKPANVFSSPAEARAAKLEWSYVIVATKALGDDSKLLEGLVNWRGDRREVGRTTGDGASIVLIQNGLGVEEAYVRRFPGTPVLSGVTIVSAAQERAGEITHNRWTRISIGPFLAEGSGKEEERRATEANEAFVRLLKEGGIKDAEAYEHAKLQLLRWHKVGINAAMNPSSVLSGGSSNGAMSTDEEMYVHLKGVMDEVFKTAETVHGQKLPKEFASSEAILRSTQKNTSGSRPSMALDWESGKEMELEAILGAPIRIARENGVEMPRLQSMYALIKMAQANRDSKTKEKVNL